MSVKGEVFFQFKSRLNEILARIWTVANSLLSVHSIMSHALSSPHYACENLSSLQELFHLSFSDALVRHCFYSIWESLSYCPVMTPLCAEHSQLGQMRGEQRRTERQVKKFSWGRLKQKDILVWQYYRPIIIIITPNSLSYKDSSKTIQEDSMVVHLFSDRFQQPSRCSELRSKQRHQHYERTQVKLFRLKF